jgi:hypothetical protein
MGIGPVTGAFTRTPSGVRSIYGGAATGAGGIATYNTYTYVSDIERTLRDLVRSWIPRVWDAIKLQGNTREPLLVGQAYQLGLPLNSRT